jgi:hypothetical protein
MRMLYLAAAAAIVAVPALVMGITPAKAQNAPFCMSNYDGGGTENCNFITYRECQATVSGIGASCVLNPYYAGSNAAGPAGAFAYAPGPYYRRPLVRGYVGF